MKDNEIVSIPGLRGREPKEISVKIWQALFRLVLKKLLNRFIMKSKLPALRKNLLQELWSPVVVRNCATLRS